MEKNSFTLVDQNGEEKTYDVLFTFDNEETNKSYIVYTDNTKDELGNIKVYANTYNEDSIQVLEGNRPHVLPGNHRRRSAARPPVRHDRPVRGQALHPDWQGQAYQPSACRQSQGGDLRIHGRCVDSHCV